MLTRLARQLNLLSLQKTGCRLGLAWLLLLTAAGSVHDATASNETRTLSFHHTHSGEDLTVTFKRDGRYDPEALKQLNHFLRDWRTQDQTEMAPHLFDIIWEVYRDVDGKQPIQIVSAYRSPATNAMLRHRSAHSGVARSSQHMLGHAMDFYIPDVPLEKIRFAGLRLQRGGVGFYPTSGSPFVHLDTGNIRYWPRMSHNELAKVFPDGRTVLMPSDGIPLKGYELAKADIGRRGNGDDTATITKPSLFAALFRSRSSDEDDDDASASVVNDRAAATVVAMLKPAGRKAADRVPTPRAKPSLTAALQLASADAQIAHPAKPPPQAAGDQTAANPLTPADIINARGFWDNMPAGPKQATPSQVAAAISARRALDAADPRSSAGIRAVYQALAYAPGPSPVDDGKVVAAATPAPDSAHASMLAANSAAATGAEMAATKGAQATTEPITNSARIAAASTDSAWLRIVMLAPSVGGALSVTVLGDTDLTLMRTFFVKPKIAVNMSFSADPMMGLACDHFSGSVTPNLNIISFALRTASAR